jgi:sugar phosphate isomerase/epimerase
MSKYIRPFGIHQLAGPGILNAGRQNLLTRFTATAHNNGCTILDIGAGAPLNNLTPAETAEAMKRGGIDTAIGTIFFPGNQCMGNPIYDNGRDRLSLDSFRAGIHFLLKLRKNGIKVAKIAGPSCFCVDFDYRAQFPGGITDFAANFYRELKSELNGEGLTVVLEYLRPSESIGAISSVEDVRAISNAVGNRTVLWHADTFHMQSYGRDPAHEIRKGGDILGYLHAHGNRRLPAGAKPMFGKSGVTDRTDWINVASALDEVGYDGEVVTEPFGAKVRAQIPALGDGLLHTFAPRDHLRITRRTLQRAGVIG